MMLKSVLKNFIIKKKKKKKELYSVKGIMESVYTND